MNEKPISRKDFFTSFFALTLLAAPRRASASPTISTPVSYDSISADEYFMLKEQSDCLWFALSNQNGVIVDLGHFTSLAAASYAIDERGVAGEVIKKIAVWVGKKLVGYLKAKVSKKGIVKSIVGEFANPVLQEAGRRIINQPYRSSYYLPCDVYPTHSMEYIRCQNGQ